MGVIHIARYASPSPLSPPVEGGVSLEAMECGNQTFLWKVVVAVTTRSLHSKKIICVNLRSEGEPYWSSTGGKRVQRVLICGFLPNPPPLWRGLGGGEFDTPSPGVLSAAN